MHSIRLHGPWQVTELHCDDSKIAVQSATNSKKILIPDQWTEFLSHSSEDSVMLERAFGLPTGLDSDQQIWLVVESNRLTANIFLNHELLGKLSAGEAIFRRSVRPQLQIHNRLQLIVAGLSESSQLENAGNTIREVRLEIIG